MFFLGCPLLGFRIHFTPPVLPHMHPTPPPSHPPSHPAVQCSSPASTASACSSSYVSLSLSLPTAILVILFKSPLLAEEVYIHKYIINVTQRL